MPKGWKKEVARDIIALGSIPFYLLVLIRAIIGKHANFVYHMIIAFLILFILSKIIKNSNQYIARSFIIIVFSSFFYTATLYTVFVSLVWVMMIFSSRYLKTKESIFKGIILGIVTTLASYGVVLLI